MPEESVPIRPAEPVAASDGGPLVELVLYVSLASTASLRAQSSLAQLLTGFDDSQVRLEVRDVAQHPAAAEEDHVLFTPTLVKREPLPRAWFVGALDPGTATALLLACGVEKRR